MEYKAAQIPKCAYDSLPIVKAEAIAKKVSFPEEVLSPEKCPLCEGKMQGIEATVKLGYRQCVDCGYGQPIFNLEQVKTGLSPALADLGKGALVALGIAALAYLIGTALENRG